MQQVKNAIKRTMKIDYSSYMQPLKNLHYIGSKHHGYYIPINYLHEKSICYCVGAGEDISFDTELVVRYNSRVFIFDPAPEGKNHFAKLKEAVAKGDALSVASPPFTYRINQAQLDTITYIETGVWDKETMIRFYKPTIDNYASHSIELFHKSGKFIEVPVDRLKNLMKNQNHDHIDLLKLEIEGAEYAVLNTIAEDKLDVKMILVEFDELFHAKDFKYLFRIKKATEQLLKAGYILAHSTPYFKRLFIKRELYDRLKAKE